MRNFLIVLAVTTAGLAPCAAFAGDTPATPPAATTNSNTATNTASDGDQMVCHREKLIGTLLPGPRICKSLKVWQQQQRDSQDFINNETTGNLQMNPKGG